MKHKKMFVSAAFLTVFFFCMGPAMSWASERKKYENGTEFRGILVIQVSSLLV